MITPKNWKSFQHYKKRRPPWVKLHHTLLDNYEFCCLPVASKALAPCLWLLASEYPEGKITASVAAIAFRLRMSETDFNSALTPLINSGFFIVASEMLADCKQHATPETERETETNAAPNGAHSDEADLFKRGKEVLGKQAGGLISKLLKAKQSIPLARAAIEQASTKENPREYLGRILRGPAQRELSPGQIPEII